MFEVLIYLHVVPGHPLPLTRSKAIPKYTQRYVGVGNGFLAHDQGKSYNSDPNICM